MVWLASAASANLLIKALLTPTAAALFVVCKALAGMVGEAVEIAEPVVDFNWPAPSSVGKGECDWEALFFAPGLETNGSESQFPGPVTEPLRLDPA